MMIASRLLAGFSLVVASSLLACSGEDLSATGGAAGAGGVATGQPGAGGSAAGQTGEGPGGGAGSDAGGSVGVGGAGQAGSVAVGGQAGEAPVPGGAGGAGPGGAGAAGAVAGGISGSSGQNSGGAGPGGSVGGPSCVNGAITCAAGQYCNVDSGQCAACSDMSRLEFSADKGAYLAVMTGAPERSFPRVQFIGEHLAMLLRVKQGNGAQSEYDIAAAIGQPFAGGKVEDCCVTKASSGWDDSGPLLLPSKVTASSLAFVNPAVNNAHPDARFVLLDSERDFGGVFNNQGRHVMLALRRSDGVQEHAYWQIPLLNTGRSDYSVAYAYDQGPPRFYWMSERIQGSSAAPPALYTIESNAAADTLKKVNVAIDGCPDAVLTEDLAPWVLPDGSRLFFHARCSLDAPSRIYSAALEDGQFSGAARPVTLQNFDKANHRTPSLSPDLCSLYLEADNSIHALHRR